MIAPVEYTLGPSIAPEDIASELAITSIVGAAGSNTVVTPLLKKSMYSYLV